MESSVVPTACAISLFVSPRATSATICSCRWLNLLRMPESFPVMPPLSVPDTRLYAIIRHGCGCRYRSFCSGRCEKPYQCGVVSYLSRVVSHTKSPVWLASLLSCNTNERSSLRWYFRAGLKNGARHGPQDPGRKSPPMYLKETDFKELTFCPPVIVRDNTRRDRLMPPEATVRNVC